MARSGLWLVPLVAAWVAPSALSQVANPGRATVTPVVTGVFPPGAALGATTEWTLSGRGFARAKQLIGLGQGIELLDFVTIADNKALVTVRIAPNAPTGYREIRVDGPDGISNLVLVRIDSIPQVLEVEPNDNPDAALSVSPGTAVVGILRPTDIDHVRITGKPGQRLSIDLEARRLGTAFSPVVTALTLTGSSLAQGRERPGGDRDTRFGVVVPADGVVIVSVRDNIYAGSDLAVYRLRIDTAPFATGLFPLGGPRGKNVDVALSGGTLAGPRHKSVALPASTSPAFDLGAFEGPEGAVLAPMRFVVGDENEVNEPPTGSSEKPMPIKLGVTVNGRIDREEEVDRYLLDVKKGERVRLKIQAAELGSWIDSVVTIRKPKDESVLAENDDEGNVGGAAQQGVRVNALGLAEGSQDSLLDYTVTEDGQLLVEVSDRYGSGGPEYPYRLAVGRTRPDFSVTLMLGNPNANVAANAQNLGNARFAPGLMGVFNLKPGTATPVNFSIKAEGAPGVVTLQVEGLPPGIHVEPVKVDLSSTGPGNVPASRSMADALVFRVESYADPGIGSARIVATSESKTGEKLRREATAIVGVQLSNAGVQAIPITRSINEFPIRVLGEARTRLVGPPLPPALVGVGSAGIVLQGDRLDLELQFDQSPLADPGFEFEAHAEGVGLATNTVISSGQSADDEEAKSDVLVRVLASPKARPGVYPVTVQAKFTGGRVLEQRVFVLVRQPLEILVRPETLKIKPDRKVSLWVGVRREPGCDGEIDLRVEDLPRGVTLVAPVTLAEGQTEALLELKMAPAARAISTPRDLRIIAVARMPRGAVTIESAIRPRIVSPSAEE